MLGKAIGTYPTAEKDLEFDFDARGGITLMENLNYVDVESARRALQKRNSAKKRQFLSRVTLASANPSQNPKYITGGKLRNLQRTASLKSCTNLSNQFL